MTAEDMKTNTVDSYWWNGQEPLQANTVLYEVKTKNPITFYDPILRIYPCVSVSISGKQSPVEWLAPFFVEKVAYICDIFNTYFAVVSKQKAENQPPAN